MENEVFLETKNAPYGADKIIFSDFEFNIRLNCCFIPLDILKTSYKNS